MDYSEEHGHCNVPQRCEEHPALGRYVKINRQYWVRKRFGNKTPLTVEREALLDAIGFCWEIVKGEEKTIARSWKAQFGALQAFKKKYGHCHVPANGKHERLARWVKSIRLVKNSKNAEVVSLREYVLSPEREDMLNDLGFAWTPGETPKKNPVKSQIKEMTGLPPVPKKLMPFFDDKKDKSVAVGANSRVSTKQLNKVDKPSRKSSDHFTYGNNKNWKQCFRMLSTFKEENGHTQVPFKRFPHNHPLTVLSKFVLEMRKHKALKAQHLKNDLSDEREMLLDSIDFDWFTTPEAMNGDDENVSTFGLTSSSINAIRREEMKRKKKLKEEQQEEIIDDEGNTWRVYKPVAIGKLLKRPAVEEQPPEHEETKTLQQNQENLEEQTHDDLIKGGASEMDYDSDASGDSLVF
mmetsp:Transcript_6247/g.9755  ORF Transcript_6247/g.9755 Transcript_6247/m.9755 type:complete len:408 (-) Transcript_6247:166-1389(-)